MSSSNMGDNELNLNEIPTPDSKLTKVQSEVTSKRKRPKGTSNVWDHFIKVSKHDGSKPDRCTCNYCKQEFGCTTANGTTSLHRHLNKCKRYTENKDPKQALISFLGAGGEGLLNWKFDQEVCRNALARMIIVDELPFNFVEHEGFRSFCNAIQPKFTVVSRTTITKDCMDLFMSERKKLKEKSGSLPRLCLTTDLWTSVQNLGYMCLTAHYIDIDWKLQKKIINFRIVPTPHSGEVIANAIESCLLLWGVDNLFTVTVDNASSNDVAVRNLKRKFNKKNGLLLDGDFFHVRCAAHILNLIVRDGVDEVKVSISRIQNSVRYVSSSPSRTQQFKKCVDEERIECKKCLCLDVGTRWNSTFLMLKTAIEFQKAFERLEEQDVNFAKDVTDGPPSEEDWRVAKFLCKFLETFYKTTKRMSGSHYVTSNVYFHEVIAIEHQLNERVKEGDLYLTNMAKKMKEKFDKYWGSIDKSNLLLVIAVVLDPCYKLGYVRFWYSQLFENDKVEEMMVKVKHTLERVFNQYKELESCVVLESKSFSKGKSVRKVVIDDPTEMIKQKYRNAWRSQENVFEKTELERYLDDALEEECSAFDILNWWKINASKYRVLSQIARDVLAIPVSTVASESAFSTGGRVLDQFRSSLSPKLVECLILTQDWVRISSKPIQVEEKLEVLEEIETAITEEISVPIGGGGGPSSSNLSFSSS